MPSISRAGTCWRRARTIRRAHQQDEIYYVIAGRAQIRVDGEDRAVQAGSIVFVAKHVEHGFH